MKTPVSPTDLESLDPGGGGIPSRYRDRIIYALAIAGAVFLLPFGLNNVVRGRMGLGIANLVIVGMLALNALALKRGRTPPIPVALVFIPVAAGLPLGIRALGFMAVLWCYPATMLFFCMLPRRLANLLAAGILLSVVPMVYLDTGTGAAVRFAVTLTLLVVFTNLFLGVIDSLRDQLVQQAVRDPLTGAFNRRRMDRVLRAAAARGEAASLLVMDIDHFKQVNDRFGHAGGDEVLVAVASVLAREAGGDLFRFGGEEFAVLLPGAAAQNALREAERLRRAVAEGEAGRGGRVTMSIGVAALRRGDTCDTWLNRADAALYEAKRLGRDRVAQAAETPELV
ncbi:MAG TPA: GGDEF domain-containing protein [Longimicrobium sp.]|uniref:GGDEF domain-containing protein n=1 Tax=Longimicrobium sp. TaxID=2029185 RepID=UPI002EDA0863